MTDQTQSTIRNHPLRETLLAHLAEDERELLVPAALLMERALLELTRGDGRAPFKVRMARAVLWDLEYLLEHTRETLEGWEWREGTPLGDLQVAMEKAAHRLDGARKILAPAVQAAEADR